MQNEPIEIPTGCASPEDLSAYVDGFLKAQAVAAALIADHLRTLGYEGAHALVAEVLKLQRYRFYAEDDGDGDAAPVSCPACGRLMPPP